MLEVTKNAPQMAIIQLGEAFKNFWAGRAKFPKFRKKGVDDRFTLTNDRFRVEGSRIRIPGLGWVRLRRASRSLSRKVKGSANRRKARPRLARLHARLANVRGDGLHKLTTDLTRRFHTVALEDLNVRGMVRNRSLARAVSDMGFAELRRQVEYKAAMRGGEVVFADRFYPSRKTCSDCGHVLDALPLSVRAWDCPACGAHHDRDIDAAVNLKNLAASSAVSTCGEEGSGVRRKTRVKPASTKQEVRFNHVCA